MILPLKREVFTDSLYSQNIITSDVDNDPLTLSLVNAPSWISVSSNTLAGTPRKADAGTASFTIRLSDGKVNIDSSFNIEVFVSNYAPDITSTPAITVNEKVRYEYIFRATDKNPEDAVVLNFISKPSWLTFVSGSGLLFGTPGNNEVGKYDIVLLATDGIDTTLQSYSLQVLNVNDIPVITSQKNLLSTKAGTPLEILVTDLLINDPDNTYPGDFRVEIVAGANYTFSGATVTPVSTYKGNLSVAVKVNDGSDWSATYVISINVLSTPISILHRNNSAKTISKIYPVPASQYINLEFEKIWTLLKCAYPT
ncbi:MAG: hypothetical protein HC905_00575 [Bacteroidales bacterium]|nr:hypothetical protein [Bacteroidales bacterium]